MISIPPHLSSTGKRRREFFHSKSEALKRSEELKRNTELTKRVAQTVSADLIRTAVNYDELFTDVYGFKGGLEEAC